MNFSQLMKSIFKKNKKGAAGKGTMRYVEASPFHSKAPALPSSQVGVTKKDKSRRRRITRLAAEKRKKKTLPRRKK